MRRFPKDCGVLCRVAYTLSEIFQNEHGNVASVTPGDLAKIADVSPFVIGEIFRALENRGYVKCERVGGRRLRCFISKSSPIWRSDYREILKILETL